jgi:hypothetical protein
LTLAQRTAVVAVFSLLSVPAFGQSTTSTENGVTTTTQENVSFATTLTTLTRAAGAVELGNGLNLVTALAVAGSPLPTPPGGMTFKLDPTTGLEVRSSSTFGPSFAERAITAGAGQFNVSGTVMAVTYDRLDKLPLERLELVNQVSRSNSPFVNQKGIVSLAITSQTTLIQAVMGATNFLDVAVVVPIVRLKIQGIGWTQNANFRVPPGSGPNTPATPDILTRAAGGGISTGIGDVAVQGKVRLLKFGKKPAPDAPVQPDPGGLAIVETIRLPTGSTENLRGLGVTRALSTLVFSAGKGKFKPHASVGYEFWDKGIDVVSDFEPTVTAKNAFEFGVGFELAAAPKLTLLLEMSSRQVNGGGKIGFRTVQNPSPVQAPDVSARTFPVALGEGFLKQSIIPGLKWNLMGKFLLSLNGIVTIRDNGLYDKFTPVIGLDWSF